MKEIIIDTNVVIRLLIQDIPQQFAFSKKILQDIENASIKGYLPLLVIGEIIWILRTYYNIKNSEFIPKLKILLAYKNLVVLETKKQIVIDALDLMLSKNVDFTDAYIFCTRDKREIISFDNDFKKLLKLL